METAVDAAPFDFSIGLFALLARLADALSLPAASAMAAASLRRWALGASAVQIGTALLRCPEAEIAPAWADALAEPRTRVDHPDARLLRPPRPRRRDRLRARGRLSRGTPGPPTRCSARLPRQCARPGANDVHRIQAGAGQAAALARPEPAADIVARLWSAGETL